MGEKVQIGPFVVNVFETKWYNRLGEGMNSRTPANRFLAVRLTVVNGGAAEAVVPPFQLIDERGKMYEEVQDGAGLPFWVGLLRRVKPLDTLEGNILFDARPHSYNLGMEDDSGQCSRQRITLPLQFKLEDALIPDSLSPETRATPGVP